MHVDAPVERFLGAAVRYFRRSRSGELMYGAPFELVERIGNVVLDGDPELGLNTA